MDSKSLTSNREWLRRAAEAEDNCDISVGGGQLWIECDSPEQALHLATLAAQKSLCLSQRGVVIWKNGRLISWGVNHQPSPFKCTHDEKCKRNCGKSAIHAEQSAILKAGIEACQGAQMLHVKVVDGKPVDSMSPSCLECSKMILAAGIKDMWLLHYVGAQMLGNERLSNGLTRYSAERFHWETAAGSHRIELAISDGCGAPK